MLTIVIEAGLKSGALSTARHALDLGRTLAALPGPIDSPQSMGANLLLRDGASAISSIADALSLAGITSVVQPQPLSLSHTDARVWAAIGAETLPLDTIAARAKLAPRECMAAVTTLELSGMVESLITGEIRRRI
jgi:DNA processing protein